MQIRYFIALIFLSLLVGWSAAYAGGIDGVLDWYLRRAGVDSSSEEAKASKRIGKDALNPAVSEEEMRQDIEVLKLLIVENDIDEAAVNQIYNDDRLSDAEKRHRISEQIGDIRFCNKCGRNWPIHYRYCPFDGTRLLSVPTPQFKHSQLRNVSMVVDLFSGQGQILFRNVSSTDVTVFVIRSKNETRTVLHPESALHLKGLKGTYKLSFRWKKKNGRGTTSPCAHVFSVTKKNPLHYYEADVDNFIQERWQ